MYSHLALHSRMPDTRSHKLTIRLSERELEILKGVAAAEDLTVSEWIRVAARVAYGKVAPAKSNGKGATAKSAPAKAAPRKAAPAKAKARVKAKQKK